MAPVFATDPKKQREWAAFLRRSGAAEVTLQLPAVVALVRAFVLPAGDAARQQVAFTKRWSAGEWS